MFNWTVSAWPILASAALKSTLVLGAAWLITYLLRGRSAAARHTVWTAAAAALVALPLAHRRAARVARADGQRGASGRSGNRVQRHGVHTGGGGQRSDVRAGAAPIERRHRPRRRTASAPGMP